MTEQELKAIIAKTLRKDEGELDQTRENNWDSLAHISVLVAVDKALDGRLSQIKDMKNATSLSVMIERLRAHELIT